MINRNTTIYLLAFPIGLMGLVQFLFAALSYLVFHDHEETEFIVPSLVMLSVSTLLLMLGRRLNVSKLSFRDGILFAVLTWVIMGLLGAIPIEFIARISFTDAVFESISALTTTGATVISGLDGMPKTFLLYRQFLQWLGGLGVVIFVVAILPVLNVGGMKLLKAETPGPIKSDKLSPRIATTAHYLWFVYVTLTLLCALGYFLAGMSVYDAIAHSFSTVSTGGFSTYDASLGYFNSTRIMLVANVFMLAGALSFTLHFRAWRARNIKLYWSDEEARVFLLIVLGLTLMITGFLIHSGHYPSGWQALNQALFHLISFITSTGFVASSYTEWPGAVAFILLFSGYLGGCAGSTAGGNKIIRNILSIKLIGLQFRRLVHPKGFFTVKYQGQPVESDVLSATMAFMSLVALCSMFLSMALMATGLDFWSALTAVAACLNVLGPAFGAMGSNFQPASDTGTWILSGAMILGRLEYFTVLTLFSTSFWRD